MKTMMSVPPVRRVAPVLCALALCVAPWMAPSAQAADAKTDLPRKDTTVFWKNVLSVLGWVGIGIGVLAGMVLLLAVFLIIRNYFYRKKRKRRRIHSLSDRTASHLARERMVHFYVQPDSENRGADTYRTNPRRR